MLACSFDLEPLLLCLLYPRGPAQVPFKEVRWLTHPRHVLHDSSRVSRCSFNLVWIGRHLPVASKCLDLGACVPKPSQREVWTTFYPALSDFSELGPSVGSPLHGRVRWLGSLCGWEVSGVWDPSSGRALSLRARSTSSRGAGQSTSW